MVWSSFLLCVFFFKQKTAYEMRISDWSSDVCSSDLGNGVVAFQTPLATLHAFNGWADRFLSTPGNGLEDIYVGVGGKHGQWNWQARSEEHTSELQSLMRSSYAVFCLKKKKKKKKNNDTHK